MHIFIWLRMSGSTHFVIALELESHVLFDLTMTKTATHVSSELHTRYHLVDILRSNHPIAF